MKMQLLTRKEQADALKISVRHLINLENQNIVPVVRLGRVVRYCPEAVLEALTSSKRVSK